MPEWAGWVAILVVGLCILSYITRATSGGGAWGCEAIFWLIVMLLLAVVVLGGMTALMVL